MLPELSSNPENQRSRSSGLYAIVLSTFLLDTLKRLEENPPEIIRDIIIHQTRMMRNAALSPFEPQPFDPPRHIRLTAALLFSSLTITPVATLISILIKGCAQESRPSFKSSSDTMSQIQVRIPSPSAVRLMLVTDEGLCPQSSLSD